VFVLFVIGLLVVGGEYGIGDSGVGLGVGG